MDNQPRMVRQTLNDLNLDKFHYYSMYEQMLNQRHSENISHVIADVDLMVENVTWDKNGMMISVSVSVKNQ